MSQKVFIPLGDVRVASPCHADWDMMDGNERSRFCGSCQKNVYNLSEMTRTQAEALIAEKEGHLCVRYYQRADGTVLTQDCPIGLAKARQAALAPLRWLTRSVAFLLAAGTCFFGYRALGQAEQSNTAVTKSFFELIRQRVQATPSPPEMTMVMGAASSVEFAPTPVPQVAPPPQFTAIVGMPALKQRPETSEKE